MLRKRPRDRRCSYAVLVQAASSAEDLRGLATYLSTLAVAECDVVILDPSPRFQFELNARILRWVGRHVSVRPEHRAEGGVDVLRAAAAHAVCEKVIVAAEDVRYTAETIDQICTLLDGHEVVEPQDYLDPMPWWGSIDAGRMLIHRGIAPDPDHGATFGFRRSALRSLRAFGPGSSPDAQVRRLAAVGAEVHSATDVFVRREPSTFRAWLSARARLAGDDFVLPVKTAFFFALLPLLALLAFVGGAQLAGGYATMIGIGSVALAIHGRAGASAYFPLRACLSAPLWVLERSLSVYWALFRKLRGTREDASGVPVPERSSGRRAANQ